MGCTIGKSCTPFSSIKICNYKSNQRPKLEKLVKNHVDHSKRPKHVYTSYEKKIKKEPDFSRTCGFRGDFRKSLNFHFKPSKVNIYGLDFRQNPLKVEKWLFLALYRDY